MRHRFLDTFDLFLDFLTLGTYGLEVDDRG